MTEGTTRILQTPEANKVFGQEFYEQHGSLVQPTMPIPPQANQTVRSLPAEPKHQNWLMFSALVFVGLALVAVALFFALRSPSTSTATPPAATRRGIPQVPDPPPLTQVPGEGSSAISPALFYPGSTTTQEINSPKGKMIQLQASDPFEKVVSWYAEKLKTKPAVEQKYEGREQSIFDTEPTKVIIQDDGSDKVRIILAQER